jgi:hypothetical protein
VSAVQPRACSGDFQPPGWRQDLNAAELAIGISEAFRGYDGVWYWLSSDSGDGEPSNSQKGQAFTKRTQEGSGIYSPNL